VKNPLTKRTWTNEEVPDYFPSIHLQVANEGKGREAQGQSDVDGDQVGQGVDVADDGVGVHVACSIGQQLIRVQHCLSGIILPWMSETTCWAMGSRVETSTSRGTIPPVREPAARID
jgi:hypothetical protein